MRILVLSDLHIGIKSRSKDLCPYPDGEFKDDGLVSSFISTVRKYQAENGKFDFIALPGDITNKSNLIEFDCGSKFLNKLLSELGIDSSRLIFVPGNHDVDWSVLYGDSIFEEEKILRLKHKYNSLKDSDHIFSALACPDLVTSPFIKKWEFDDVIFFGFNSSWHDDAIQKEHFGLILPNQIGFLKKQLENTDFSGKLKIFLVHHHLQQFSNSSEHWRDISIMQNAHSLLELLTEFGFNFIIHGHRHHPFFHTSNINSSRAINILCSGSYSCELPTSIAGIVGNVFHIIEIENVSKCQGKVLTFAYNNRDKWYESREQDGMHHVNPFGCELLYDDLLKLSLNEAKRRFEVKNILLLSELNLIIPDLKFLHRAQQEKIFSEIEVECNVKRTMDSTQETFFIKLGK